MSAPLAQYLIKANLVDEATATQALAVASQQKIAFIYYLTQNKIISSEKLLSFLAKDFSLNIFNLKNYNPQWLSHSPLSAELIQRYQVIPLQKENNILHLGVSDPTDRDALAMITFQIGLPVIPFLIEANELHDFIKKHFDAKRANYLELNVLNHIQQETNISLEENNNTDEPIIRFVDNLIDHAIKQSASDIHIEPYEHHCRIRYRQDGILYSIAEIPIHLANRLVTRLKVLCKLDITERRLPQDGRFQFETRDIRLSTCPTLFGEKIVLRILNTNHHLLNIESLALSEPNKKIFLEKISQSQGLILVTGPTGSGKTTTLYTAIHALNVNEKNISTVEDPIEIQLPGINQVNIHPKIGLHFGTVLKTLLRQDPDVLMIGEIRDSETAQIAMQAAQTGHLVFSTLHTNNAIETIHRLQLMGLEPFYLANSLSLIIAQRLLRKLCIHCKQPETLNSKSQQIVYRAKGCDHCLQGYQGRMAIYEFLSFTDEIKTKIIRNELQTITTFSLKEAAWQKVLAGITSLAEMNRVLNA